MTNLRDVPHATEDAVRDSRCAARAARDLLGCVVGLARERRAGDGADADAELLVDDEREARLAEPRRADEQEMVERVPPPLRGRERDRELLLHPLLADEVGEAARPERLLDLGFV